MAARALLVLLLCACFAFPAGVTVRFEPPNPLVGPFPSDALALPDPSQKTGLCINLPLPDCNAQPSACAEVGVLNQLDGFSLQPRIRVTFSGPVDVNTLRSGIQFVALDNLTQEEFGLNRPGDVIPINEVVYDPAANAVYAKPDDILDQHRRYAIIVTDAVRDRAGDRVAPDPAFDACAAARPPNEYCAAVAQAVSLAAPLVDLRRIVAASVFTTLSATTWMEKARAQLRNAPASAAMTGPGGGLRMADIAGLVWHRQTGANRFSDLEFPLDPALLAGVGRVTFGTFRSPNFLNAGQMVDAVPTGADVALPAASNEIGFTLYLPDTAKPPAGYPVVIFGHGLGDSRLGGPTAVAAVMARAGFAVIAISAVGHGFGPDSSVVFTDRAGNRVTVPVPGRGVDLNGDGTIEATEGCIVPAAGAVLRDCLRQTALDLSQLVRVIQSGISVDGSGTADLDASRIYYAGQSLGSLYGTLFNAVEPDTRAAALNAGGASVADLARWSPAFRPIVSAMLALRQPPVPVPATGFNENYVLRYQQVKVNDVPGAIDIQNQIEVYDWMGMPGDPVAFAPHLKQSTLPGMYIKPVLFQIAYGDRTVPNPSSSRWIRAANMREYTWMYRHDVARSVLPNLGQNPHAYLVLFLDAEDIRLPDLAGAAISLYTQQQMASFFGVDGAAIADPNNFVLRAVFGRDLFEVPDLLPEYLNF